MQSPFKIFRRYQKGLLAIAALMAMLAFGVLDPLTKMSHVLRGSPDGGVVVETNVGNLTENGLRELRNSRRIANRFVYLAFVTANPEYATFAHMIPTKAQHFGRDDDRDLVFAWLMRQEARRMGITVENGQIKALISEVSAAPNGTGQRLDDEQFQEILRELRISGKGLYDILKDEVAYRTTVNMTIPVATLSPEQYWKVYQQLNARQTIDVAPVPVKEFVAQVENPSPGVLSKFFEAHKSTADLSFGGEYKPGFRQPTKVDLQYLEISSAAVKQQIAEDFPVTAKDIEDYYEAKKKIDLRFQEFDTGAEDAAPGKAGAGRRGPALEHGDGTPPADDASRPEPPETPVEDEPAADEAAPKTPEADSADDAPSDAPKSDDGDAPKSDDGSCGPAGAGPAALADDDTQPPHEEPAATEKPASDSAADEDGAAVPEAAPAEGEMEAEQPDSTKVEEDEPASPGDDVILPPLGKSAKTPPRPIKYKPLDDALRDEIRDSIIDERTQQRVKELTAKASQELHAAGLRFSQQQADLDLTKLKPAEVARLADQSREALQKIAKKYALHFGDTTLVDARELLDMPGLGKAQEPDSDAPFTGRRARSVVDMAFGSDSLLGVQVAESLETGDAYVFWKIQHVDEHVPKLDDPGVKDQVIEAWKMSKALELAKTRAEQLAALVRPGKQAMGEDLTGQTVTGAPQGAKLSIYRSPEFSLWRESAAPRPGGGPPEIELSNPVVVTNPGRKFMSYVFEELKEGEVGSAPNNDASVYYVVKVVNRRPADRDAFKDAPLFGSSSQYEQLATIEIQTLIAEFYQALDRQYAVKWHERQTPSRGAMDEMEE